MPSLGANAPSPITCFHAPPVTALHSHAGIVPLSCPVVHLSISRRRHRISPVVTALDHVWKLSYPIPTRLSTLADSRLLLVAWYILPLPLHFVKLPHLRRI